MLSLMTLHLLFSHERTLPITNTAFHRSLLKKLENNFDIFWIFFPLSYFFTYPKVVQYNTSHIFQYLTHWVRNIMDNWIHRKSLQETQILIHYNWQIPHFYFLNSWWKFWNQHLLYTLILKSWTLQSKAPL